MRRFSLFTSCWAVILTAGAAVALEPIPADQARGLGNACPAPASACDPLWTVDVGAVILRRESPSVYPVFDFGFQGGVDADIRRRLGEQNQLQVRYFGIDNWSDRAASELFDEDEIVYSSDLHSTEINLRSRRNDWLTFLAGFRWVENYEDFDWNVTAPNAGYARRWTRNQMYGGQVGADMLVWDRGGPFSVNTELKAGIYSNLATGELTDASGAFDGVDPDAFFPQRTRPTAFLGEFGVNARYEITDNFAVRGGYQLLWLEGLAIAERQPPANSLDTRGGLFYHGATVGGEFRW